MVGRQARYGQSMVVKGKEHKAGSGHSKKGRAGGGRQLGQAYRPATQGHKGHKVGKGNQGKVPRHTHRHRQAATQTQGNKNPKKGHTTTKMVVSGIAEEAGSPKGQWAQARVGKARRWPHKAGHAVAGAQWQKG